MHVASLYLACYMHVVSPYMHAASLYYRHVGNQYTDATCKKKFTTVKYIHACRETAGTQVHIRHIKSTHTDYYV